MATKEFFRQKGIVFQDFDLSKDQEAVTRMLKLTRQKRVPVIQKGENYVVGFKAEEIEKLLGS
jgi:glutaredoxin